MKRNLLPLMLTAAAGSMTLAACDSAAENNAEDQAEAVRESGEAKADAMEDQADKMR